MLRARILTHKNLVCDEGDSSNQLGKARPFSKWCWLMPEEEEYQILSSHSTPKQIPGRLKS